MSEPGKKRWRRAADAIPTRWLILAVVALVVATSAIFGGLDDAPPRAIERVKPGGSFHGLRLDVSASKAVLIDGFPDTDIVTDDGKRLLVVVATVTNHWHAPVRPAAAGGHADTIGLSAVPGVTKGQAPDYVAVTSDAALSPDLEPGVPIELTFIWNVDPGAVTDGDSLHLQLWDEELHVNGDLLTGENFEAPRVAGTMVLPVKDVGAGTTG